MATVVLDSKNLVESIETGKIIEPPEVLADRAGPQKPVPRETKEEPKEAGKPAEKAKDEAAESEEGEDENGLTEEQKKTFTEAMKRTISRKHRQLREAEEFAADQYNNRRLAEERLSKLESELAELKAKAAKAEPAQESKKPDPKEFKTQEEYTDALVAFRVAEQLDKERKEAAERARKEAQEKQTEVLKARIARAVELVPDYEEVVSSTDTQVPAHIGQYMAESEKFAELGYYFAKHPEELERLAAMPANTYGQVMRVGVELDKISDKLKAFAPVKADSGEPKANGHGADKPSQTESASAGTGPSHETESSAVAAGPSESREAPVIRPLAQGSASQVKTDPSSRTTREEIEAWKRKQPGRANLQVRKRH